MRRTGHVPTPDDDAAAAFAAFIAADAEPDDERAGRRPPRGRGRGWRTALGGSRALWITAIVAVLALVAGLGLGRLVSSPSQAAADAEAPDAGLITVPVEERALSNDVVLRGDVVFADAVSVQVDTAELTGPAVVTGQVPPIGTMLDARSIALEVAGRPVIVLPGELPAYRTLRSGSSGPDVLQLHQALAALGLAVDPASTIFDATTARAVRALYEQVGYTAPEPPASAVEALDAAEAAVASSSAAVSQAQATLQAAMAGPTAAQQREQENLVHAALLALEAAQSSPTPDPVAIATLLDAYELAVLQAEEALATPGTATEQYALYQATSARDQANADLAAAQTALLPSLPLGEVLFLTDLPRRVDEVAVARGGLVEGAAMSVSGATLEIQASASTSDAALLQVGAIATFALPDGSDASASIAAIGGPSETDDADADGSTPGARVQVTLAPQELAPEVVDLIRGTNVRLAISVEATAGLVLAVPIAALTAGPSGESRVEVSTGGETTLVEVTTGLAAEGFVEVSPVAGARLDPGDLVVVGQ